MNFLIIYILTTQFIDIVLSTQNFILTSKSNKKNSDKIKNKIKKKLTIGQNEFIFASNLTTLEVSVMSQDYTIEKDEIASIKWHLDRIDQRFLPLSNTEFKETNINNSQIDMYIVDTGVDLIHTEFSNNQQVFLGNFVGDNVDTDCNGHGTHVASLAVGAKYGVAKKANLFSVKVLDCSGSGSYSGIISAIDRITNNAKARGKISVVNMSLGGPGSTALDTAITNSINTGVYYVVAAGNSNANACNYSPSRVPNAITIAASDKNDYKASFSNFGSCIDMYSPGVSLLAAWPNNNVATLSGTSMASPVAAGILATYFTKYGMSGYTTFLNSLTNNVILKNPRTTINKLVFI